MFYEGFGVRSIEVDQICDRFGGHFWTVLMDLEAEMLSESRFLNAPSPHIGFGN